MAPRPSVRQSWTREAVFGALLVAIFVGGGAGHRAERAADIQVEVNGDLTTSKYLTTTRPLPTGVLLSSAPTFVSDGTTSEYTTLVIGTVANGFYSRIVSTAERVFYAIPRSGERPQPTGVVSEAVNTEVHGSATTVHRTRYIRTSFGTNYGQVIERTSSVVPQLESSSQEPLPTLTIGMPVSYPSAAPLATQPPVEINEIPTARRVVQGEEVIIVDDVVRPAPAQKALPTYTADGDSPLKLDEPLVVVPDRASFQKTQALLNEKVNKMVKDLNLKEGSNRESRDFSDLETIEILDLDLALSGSELTTVTYVGFSDFVTTIGSTVVVFMPQSAGAAQIRAKISKTAGPHFVGPTRAGKSVLLSRAPVFIPNRGGVITTTRTFVSHDKMATKNLEDKEKQDMEKEKEEAGSQVSKTNVISTASTRVYNTVDLYPTGLVTSIGGTVAREKVTTVFTTLVYGTFIKGRYAKVVKSTSSIYFLVSKTASIEPTSVAPVAPSTLPVISNNLGRAVGSGAGEQVIVGSADEAKAALKESQQLEGSLAPKTAPALFSSQADGEEEKSVLKTFYTTFTYFTTLTSGDSTEVKTSLSTVTSVATESLPLQPLTYYTTFTYFTTSQVGGQEIVSTRYETKSQVVAPTKAVTETADPLAKLVTKTFFTTYTYFTTSHAGDSSVVQSRLVVSSNVVTSTVSVSATAAPAPAAAAAVAPSLEPARAPSSVVQYSTGLLSSLVSSEVNNGITTVSSTGYFGTSVNGLYAQIIRSTTMTIDPEVTPTSVQSISETPASKVAGPPSLPRSISVSATATFNSPSSGTKPLLISSSVITTAPKNILSSLSSQISSSAASSSSRIQSTNRSFLPFRTSNKRKSSGLLALLAAKKGGFSAPVLSPSSTKSEATTTTDSSSTSAIQQSSVSSVAAAPSSTASSEEISVTPTVRRLVSRTRRPFPGLRRPGGRPGPRGLFRNRIRNEDVPVTEPEVETTTAPAVEEEQSIEPTEEVVTEEVQETTTETVTTKPPRVLAFGRSRPISGTRNALPLRRRPKAGGRGGLASRFSSVTAGGDEPETTAATTTTTTEEATEPPTKRTTEAPTEIPTEPSTEQPTEAPIPSRRGRGRGRGRGRQRAQSIRRTVRRRRPIRGRRRRPTEEDDLEGAGSEVHEKFVIAEPLPEHANFFEQNHFLDDAGSEVAVVVADDVDPLLADAEVAETGDFPVLSRTKRQSSFGARTRSRDSRRESLSRQETLIETSAGSASSTENRARRQSRRRNRARSSRQSEATRARSVSPTPTTDDEKEKFTLTSSRSRGSTRSRTGSTRSSSSSTRRAIPGSRRSRPSSGSSNSGGAVSLRQRLQQAQLAAAATSAPPRAPTRDSGSSRDSTRGSSFSARRPSRISSQRGSSSSRNRQRKPLVGSDRGREPPKIDPTPVLDDGQIIVISEQQVAVSIPVVANGRTTFRDVFTARTVTETLELDQYTETEVSGELRTHVGRSTAVGNDGITEVSTLYLQPTEIKTRVRSPTRIRGRATSVFSSYRQPGYTVVPEVNTIAPAQVQPTPSAQNNNALTALLQQLLANQGGQPPPALGSSFNAPVAPTKQAYRTVSFTTSYVTTVTESDVTTVPIFFQGRQTHTVIVNTDVKVITATEVVTSSEPIPGQTVAPAPAFGGLGGLGNFGGLGLTPQQLLLQQLLNQPARPQLPAIQATAARSLFPQSREPPQLEELLRQATEVERQQPAPPQLASTSVVTIYVSGSQPGEFFTRLSTVTLDGPEVTRIKRGQMPTAAVRATEIPAFIETDQGLFKVPKDPHIFGDLDYYVMSAMNEISPDMIQLGATQTLESVKGKATRYREKIIDVVPSLTGRHAIKTDSFLWEGPAESAPLRREKRQATRGRAGSNGNDLSFAPRNIDHVQGVNRPVFTTYTYASTVTDEFGSVLVKTAEHILPKVTTHSNIEFVELTKLGVRPTVSDSLLFGILATEADPITKTLVARGQEINAARKSRVGGKQIIGGFQTSLRASSGNRRRTKTRARNGAASTAIEGGQDRPNVSRKPNPFQEEQKEDASDSNTSLLSSIEQNHPETGTEGHLVTAPLPAKTTGKLAPKSVLRSSVTKESAGRSASRSGSRRTRVNNQAVQASSNPVILTDSSNKLERPPPDTENDIDSDSQRKIRGRRVRVRTRQRVQPIATAITASSSPPEDGNDVKPPIRGDESPSVRLGTPRGRNRQRTKKPGTTGITQSSGRRRGRGPKRRGNNNVTRVSAQSATQQSRRRGRSRSRSSLAQSGRSSTQKSNTKQNITDSAGPITSTVVETRPILTSISSGNASPNISLSSKTPDPGQITVKQTKEEILPSANFQSNLRSSSSDTSSTSKTGPVNDGTAADRSEPPPQKQAKADDEANTVQVQKNFSTTRSSDTVTKGRRVRVKTRLVGVGTERTEIASTENELFSSDSTARRVQPNTTDKRINVAKAEKQPSAIESRVNSRLSPSIPSQNSRGRIATRTRQHVINGQAEETGDADSVKSSLVQDDVKPRDSDGGKTDIQTPASRIRRPTSRRRVVSRIVQKNEATAVTESTESQVASEPGQGIEANRIVDSSPVGNRTSVTSGDVIRRRVRVRTRRPLLKTSESGSATSPSPSPSQTPSLSLATPDSRSTVNDSNLSANGQTLDSENETEDTLATRKPEVPVDAPRAASRTRPRGRIRSRSRGRSRSIGPVPTTLRPASKRRSGSTRKPPTEQPSRTGSPGARRRLTSRRRPSQLNRRQGNKLNVTSGALGKGGVQTTTLSVLPPLRGSRRGTGSVRNTVLPSENSGTISKLAEKDEQSLILDDNLLDGPQLPTISSAEPNVLTARKIPDSRSEKSNLGNDITVIGDSNDTEVDKAVERAKNSRRRKVKKIRTLNTQSTAGSGKTSSESAKVNIDAPPLDNSPTTKVSSDQGEATTENVLVAVDENQRDTQRRKVTRVDAPVAEATVDSADEDEADRPAQNASQQVVRVTRTRIVDRKTSTSLGAARPPDAVDSGAELDSDKDARVTRRQRVRVTRTRNILRATASPTIGPETEPVPKTASRQRGGGRLELRPIVPGTRGRVRQVGTRTRLVPQSPNQSRNSRLSTTTESSTSSILNADDSETGNVLSDGDISYLGEQDIENKARTVQRKQIRKIKRKKVIQAEKTLTSTSETPVTAAVPDRPVGRGGRRRVVNVRRRLPSTATDTTNPAEINAETTGVAVDEGVADVNTPVLPEPDSDVSSRGSAPRPNAPTRLIDPDADDAVTTTERPGRDPALFSRFNRRRRPVVNVSPVESNDRVISRGRGRQTRLRRPEASQSATLRTTTAQPEEEVTESAIKSSEGDELANQETIATTDQSRGLTRLRLRNRRPLRPSISLPPASTTGQPKFQDSTETPRSGDDDEGQQSTTTERTRVRAGLDRTRRPFPLRPSRPPRTQRPTLALSTQSQNASEENTEIEENAVSEGAQDVTTTERARGLLGLRLSGRRPPRPSRPALPLRPTSSPRRRPPLIPTASGNEDAGRLEDNSDASVTDSADTSAVLDTRPDRVRPTLRPSGRRRPARPLISTSPQRPSVLERPDSRPSILERPVGRPPPGRRARPALPTRNSLGEDRGPTRNSLGADRGPTRSGFRALNERRNENELSTESRPAALSRAVPSQTPVTDERRQEDAQSLTTSTTERPTTSASPTRRIPFFPGLARDRDRSRTRRPPISLFQAQNFTPRTQRPPIIPTLGASDEDIIDEGADGASDEDVLDEDVTKGEAEVSADAELHAVEEENAREDLPSNVVYRKFSTVKLVEILGGRQTLTLPVLTSTLTTLASSELHLLTDAPGLFDGSSAAPPVAAPPIRPTRQESSSPSRTTSTRPDSLRSSRRLFGPVDPTSSRELRPLVDFTAPSRRPPSRSQTALPGISRSSSVRPESTRKQVVLFSTFSPTSDRPFVTTVKETQSTSAKQPLLIATANSGAQTATEDANQKEDVSTSSAPRPQSAPVPGDAVNAIGTPVSPLRFSSATRTAPDIQGSLFVEEREEERAKSGASPSVIQNILASSSDRATPSLSPSVLRPNVPFSSRPARTSYRALTSSGTVVIFGKLITDSAINQRGSIIPARRPPFGRTVFSEDVSEVGATSTGDPLSGIATKVMENGVPVLVAGGKIPPEQIVSNGQVVFSSGTLTLPPVSLSDIMSLSPSSETDPELGTRGTDGFDKRFYRTHTYYTTFTFLNHIREGDRSVVLTTRETVSNVLTLPAAVTTPSSTRFQTSTYLTTYTYFRTTTRGTREQVTSTQEVVTQIVVTEAPAAPATSLAPPQRVTKTYLSTVTLFDTAFISGTQVLRSRTSVVTDVAVETLRPAPRPTAVRPTIRATVAPSRQPPTRPPPVVDASLLPVGEQDEIHVVATKTFYTTSTFYTTLLEGSSTVVHTRTEVTSRVQTEKVTTRLHPSHLSSLRGSLSRPAPAAFATTQTPSIDSVGPLKTTAPVQAKPTPSQTIAASTPTSFAPVPADGENQSDLGATEQAAVSSPTPASTVGSVSVPVSSPDPVPSSVPTSPPDTESTPESATPTASSASTSSSGTDGEQTTLVLPASESDSFQAGAASLLTPSTAALTSTPGVTPAGASSSAGGTTTTPAPDSSTQSPAASLGNLAGSLLGLSGIGAAGLGGLNLGSMVDTAAGLFRNVLPIAVRRDGSAGVPPDAARPPPAVQVQQRNPAFIPVGGLANNLRRQQQKQQLDAAGPGGPDGSFLAVRGPGGSVIRLRGEPSGGAPGGPPPLRPPQRSGAPVRRVERPRRPGPVRRPLRPNNRPLKPQPRPNRRQQQQQPHVARPNGFIAVFPNGREPPHQQSQENRIQLERVENRPGQPFQFHLGPGAPRPPAGPAFGAPGATRVHVSITTGAETQFVRPTAVGGQPPFTVPQPQPVVVVGGTLAPGLDTRRVDRLPPDSANPPAYVHAELAEELNRPSFGNQLDGQGFSGQQVFDGQGYVGQASPEDQEYVDQQAIGDQEYAASVQGPFGSGQLTFFNGADGGFRPDPELRRPVVRPVPQDLRPGQPGQVFFPVKSTSTLHTIASLDGDNRIVGTNVFADVVPITTRPAVIRFPPNSERRRPPQPTASTPLREVQTTRGPEPFIPSAPAPAPSPSQAPLPASVVVPVPAPSSERPPPADFSLPATEAEPEPETFTQASTTVAESTEASELVPERASEPPSLPVVDLELSASTEHGQTARRRPQTSGGISGDEENDKINFIVSSSFEPTPSVSRASSRTPDLTSTRQPVRLADRIRQTLLASLSSVAAEAAASSRDSSGNPSRDSSGNPSRGSSVRVGSSTAILGPDVRTLRPDTRTTSRSHSSQTVIRGESTVFGGLFTRPPLPADSVHDITEIVHGPDSRPVTKYITRTEQFTRTVTATKTDIRFEGSTVLTSTKVITSTLPPITIVSTVIGTSTQIHTLNTATPTRVEPLATASTAAVPREPAAPRPPGRQPEGQPEPVGERDRLAIAGVLVPDAIELGGAQQGVSDDNEVNRVILSPGGGQQLVVEQAEAAAATLCDRPCLPAIFETCRQVGDGHRCTCRPGYARAREQDPCEPTLTYRLHVLLDRVNDIPLSFRPQFADRSSAEYSQMSLLTERGLREALDSTPLAERLHTARLMGFTDTPVTGGHGRPRPRLEGLMAEIMVQLSERENESLDRATLKGAVEQSLRSSNYSLGGQQVVVARHTDAITAVDFDECENADYNDCHEHAFCYNLAGTFTCSCKDGMVDLNVNDSPGRSCSTESVGCKECSYSGECYSRDDGATGCHCHRWYAGQRCQINLRVLLIALVTVGAVLALMLCACCFLCCRRRGRSHVAPPLVFTGPAGFLRHRGTNLHNPVLERRAMLDSSSDTSATSPPRRVIAPPGGKRAAPVPPASMAGRSRKSGRTNASFQEDRSLASTGVRPAVFIPRAKHRHPQQRPPSAASSAVRVGADGSADMRASQTRLMSVLEPGGRGRRRSVGTFNSQRAARSVSGGRRPARDELVSHHPTGRSRSSDNLSQRADSLTDAGDYGSHAFFRERTMSEARSFDETTIRPSVRSLRGYGTQRSRPSSRALSSHVFSYDHHTMAERDAASTFVMPETQLFRPPGDSDGLSVSSMADDFPRIHTGSRSSRPPSTAGSRRGHR